MFRWEFFVKNKFRQLNVKNNKSFLNYRCFFKPELVKKPSLSLSVSAVVYVFACVYIEVHLSTTKIFSFPQLPKS